MYPLIQRYFRLRRWLYCLQEALSAPVKAEFSARPEKPRLLIIKTEAIGDYILFRNFLAVIRNHPRYANWNITLLGNEVWQSLANSLDSNSFDEAVFINRNQFQKDKSYRHQMIKKLMKEEYNEIVNTTFSREYLLGDTVVRHLKAPVKTGMRGDSVSEIPFLKKMGDQYYTRLYSQGSDEAFEFYRLRAFMDAWLEQKTGIEAPFLQLSNQTVKPYAVIMPGAQDAFRRWDAHSYKQVAQWLYKQGLEVVVSGSESDAESADIILKDLGSAGHNQCGKAPLQELPALLASASLVICNDSGSLHLAAALGVSVIGISNGNHYGRFTPYPAEMKPRVHMIYPPSFLTENPTEAARMACTRYKSNYNIAEVEVQTVIETAERILHG